MRLNSLCNCSAAASDATSRFEVGARKIHSFYDFAISFHVVLIVLVRVLTPFHTTVGHIVRRHKDFGAPFGSFECFETWPSCVGVQEEHAADRRGESGESA